MLKKFFSILVVVSVVGLVLGGCGKKEEDATTGDAAATTGDAAK
jgi:hypothetical protein